MAITTLKKLQYSMGTSSPPKPKKKVSPEIAELVTFFKISYKEIFGSEYISFPKDNLFMAKFVERQPKDNHRKIISWLIEHGSDIGIKSPTINILNSQWINTIMLHVRGKITKGKGKPSGQFTGNTEKL